MLFTEPTSLYVPALMPPFKVTSLNTFPGWHCPAIEGFTLFNDFCPWAMRPFGVLVDSPWFGPRNPFGCGFTFDVKFGVMKASEVLSAMEMRDKTAFMAWLYHKTILIYYEKNARNNLFRLPQKYKVLRASKFWTHLVSLSQGQTSIFTRDELNCHLSRPKWIKLDRWIKRRS